jgi:nitrite reductase/ring-hydroxylating ferredoxin subunit/multimeric flavodoxin WrbA
MSTSKTPPDDSQTWHDVGGSEELAAKELQQVNAGRQKIALCYRDGTFSAISGVCNHAGGPLGEGRLDGDYVVCPWHNWKFHCKTGEGEPGYEEDRVPKHEVRVENGRVLVSASALTKRNRKPHATHPLTKVFARGEKGGTPLDAPWRIVGISTTNMDEQNQRFSTSDFLLNEALKHAASQGAETRLVRLSSLHFRACEGYYSKSAKACTWPCSITQMDPTDQMDQVYESFVQWCDIMLIATPIRWGNASSLYYKMAERMNCIQNQITLSNRVLLRNKVVGMIITGGQDNIQSVAGQMMNFFGELGCQFPQFPYIAHSRGWSAEDMERNVSYVQTSKDLLEGAQGLVERCTDTAETLLGKTIGAEKTPRGGRKAHQLDVKSQL